MKNIRLVAVIAILASFAFGSEWEPLNIKSNNTLVIPKEPSGDYVSMDRIVGRDPETGEARRVLKEVSKEEYEMIKAKELNKKAYEKAEEARMKLERAKQSGDEAKIKEAERKLEEANRDVELSKAKIEDLKAKQVEKKAKAQNLDSNVSKGLK